MKAPSNPNAKKIYRPFLVVTVASLLGIIALIALGDGARTGPLFVALLASFAIYVRGIEMATRKVELARDVGHPIIPLSREKVAVWKYNGFNRLRNGGLWGHTSPSLP